jgi:hypothetical protein
LGKKCANLRENVNNKKHAKILKENGLILMNKKLKCILIIPSLKKKSNIKFI